MPFGWKIVSPISGSENSTMDIGEILCLAIFGDIESEGF